MAESIDGGEVLAALESVRAFHIEVAKLLRTAEAHLRDEYDWQPLLGSQCLSDLSYSLNHPEKWLPAHASRFFEVDGQTVAFVAVVMGHARTDSLVTPLVEPLVYGGWARYEGERAEKFRSVWLCKMWHWMGREKYRTVGAGRVAVRTFDGEKVADGVQFQQGCVEPVGLVSIRGEADLVGGVLEPLATSVVDK